MTSLRYPATFSGKERIVELTGEAYFEIAHSSQYPFKVIVPSWRYDGPQIEVEVLGTDFDIRAYPDEMRLQAAVKDGSVKVSKGLVSVIIGPGERITFDSSSDQPKVDRPDVSAVISRTQDDHIRIKGDIKSVMQQLGKWFDFDVVYNGPIPNATIEGSFSKTEEFSVIMKQLGTIGVHYTIKGKKVTILP